jgi:hypothetical protein
LCAAAARSAAGRRGGTYEKQTNTTKRTQQHLVGAGPNAEFTQTGSGNKLNSILILMSEHFCERLFDV